MSLSSAAAPSASRSGASPAWRWSGLAFLYWLACLASLEPGTIASRPAGWIAQHWGSEVVRITAAACLGMLATPALLMLAERFPIGRRAALRATLANLGGVVVLALGLVALSCVLAAWLLRGEAAPSGAYIASELAAHASLVAAYLAGFLAAIHAVRRLADAAPSLPAPREAAGTEWLTVLPIKERGRLTLLDLRSVDWIETQGNYQALHAGETVRLVRETSARLCERLDPSRFVRIHRQTIVALDRVRSLQPLSNGDAVLRLSTGAELRVTRRHREGLRRRLEQ
ncbi:MAG TPA: LytTR family transcriptional regulator DNA-binding domain-containing protein [Caulobacteraceae bacterium]|jgi:DNA-binding LytR/AlgR family response regulator